MLRFISQDLFQPHRLPQLGEGGGVANGDAFRRRLLCVVGDLQEFLLQTLIFFLNADEFGGEFFFGSGHKRCLFDLKLSMLDLAHELDKNDIVLRVFACGGVFRITTLRTLCDQFVDLSFQF